MGCGETYKIQRTISFVFNLGIKYVALNLAHSKNTNNVISDFASIITTIGIAHC